MNPHIAVQHHFFQCLRYTLPGFDFFSVSNLVMFSVSFDRNTFIHSEVILERPTHTARSRWNHFVKKKMCSIFFSPNHSKMFMQMNRAFQISNQNTEIQPDRKGWKDNLNLKLRYKIWECGKRKLYFRFFVNKLTWSHFFSWAITSIVISKLLTTQQWTTLFH